MNFIYIKAAEVLNRWLGESEAAVREIFSKAKDELEKELETLHEGISVRIESPTDDRAIMWNFADLKRDIDDAAEELWQVLKSDALDYLSVVKLLCVVKKQKI